MVALSGPVVSLALTCLWGLAALALPSGPLQTFTAAQAIVNGSLLALNLLPGYPLVGGRVLKAALWFLMDEELSAARLARQIGRTFGWGMIIIGALFTLRSGDISVGLLLGAGGYILNRIAHNGYQQLILQLTLRSVSVADVMQRLYPTIPPDLLLDQFVERFVLAHNEHGFPVVERPEVDTPQPLLGLMTVRDLRRFSRRQRTVTRVQEAMTPVGHVPILPPDGSATDALRMLVESGHELLPVVGDDQLLGVVRRRDLAHYIRARLARE
jgi:CBS domain-containing protein